MRWLAVATLALTASLGPAALPAGAAPAEPSAGELSRSLAHALRCTGTRLLRPRARCREPAPPAAAGTFVEDVVALAFGPNARPAAPAWELELWPQLRCQWTIARSAFRYARRSLRLREAGLAREESERWTRALLAPITSHCRVEVRQGRTGVVLPAVGPQCAAALGPPGALVDPESLAACLARLLSLWADRARGDPAPLRPNVVLIVTDDQRWDTIGSTHSPDGEPAMRAVADRLADEGVTFRNAFATTPVCTPSRVSVLTGQYAFRHGVLRNNPSVGGGAPAFDDVSTLATWLREVGYRTGHFGKYLNFYTRLWDAERDPPYVPPGWDEWRVFRSNGNGEYFDFELVENDAVVPYVDDYSTDVLAQHVLDFVEKALGADAPFFVSFSPATVHAPYVPAPRHLGTFAGLADWIPPSGVPEHPDFAVFMEQRSRQLEMLQSLDEFVDALMDTLEAAGAADDTIVILTSDNGLAWGERGFASKNCPYDECLRIPLVVRYPRLAPLPRELTTLAATLDLAPTLAELAGAPLPPGRDGRSLVRALDGTDRTPREDLLFESYSGFRFEGVRSAEWKYVEVGGQRQLFDLVGDPWELDDRAREPGLAEVVARLRARLGEIRGE